MNTILLVLLLLTIKHFVVDFLLQNKFQWSNKGTYGHFGGVLHAALHGIGTYLCFLPFLSNGEAYISGLIDGFIHYHIDWTKMNINKRMGWTPTTHEQFWWLLGLDQLLHSLTYLAIVWHLTRSGLIV
jgi:hypothetical protein